MEEKISVVVPVYKVEKYLKKCLDTILGQTYKNLEIIIVDDGSPDNCPAIIDEYAKLDSRIKAMHKENGGVSSARNLGLLNATGKYVIFLDSDDTIASDMLEKLYNAMTRNDADIAICKILRVMEDENGEFIPLNPSEEEYKETIYSNIEIFEKLMHDGDVGNFVVNKLFKKELLEGTTFPEGKVYEDAGTTYKIIAKANKIVGISEKLYYYLVGRIGSTTTSFSEKKILDSMEAYCGQYEFLAKNYPQVKEIASVSWAKMFASAMEKILMNNYEELWKSEAVINKYNVFKDAMKNVTTDLLKEYLEPYRFLSVVLLDRDMETYKHMFNEVLKIKLNK